MTQFELIIFDCDGVLVDTEAITTSVIVAMLNELGSPITFPELYHSLHGRSMSQALTLIAELLGKPLPEMFVPTLRRRAAAALSAGVTPIVGVVDALASIHRPVCVASSGDSAKIQLTLGKTGLLSHFGANIFSADDVEHPKPAPDIYLHAAQQNGVEPRCCAVIEDSPIGVQAGVAAGMTVFGFAAQTPAQQLRDAGAHVIFTDMAQLPDLLLSPRTFDLVRGKLCELNQSS